MFQSFNDRIDRAQAPMHIRHLAEHLTSLNCDGFLIPRGDEFQGEYVAAHSERLAWLTGFTGSAGMGLLLAQKLHLFVDGRYTLQAANQTPKDIVVIEDLVQNPPHLWLQTQELSGQRIAFDPWLHTIAGAAKLRQTCQTRDIDFIPLSQNPIDDIWHDQPSPPASLIETQPLQFAGQSPKDKIADLCAYLRDIKADAFLLADPTESAWLFNMRAKDIPHTPIALCFALVFACGKSILFLDEKRLSADAQKALPPQCNFLPLTELEQTLSQMAEQKLNLLLDENQTPDAIRTILEKQNGKWTAGKSPITLKRALKNDAELKGARAAHKRDGIAMCQFLAWLDTQAPEDLNEINAAEMLETKRREIGEISNMPLQDISFDTISGSGPNGAIVHYRVTKPTNRTFKDNELYLVDSGGQYRDGTTDITRTVAIGKPSNQMRSDFTRVLKGMIAISLAKFPEGTRGMDLDPLARQALWQVGLDYGHGTGHGVGAFLSVHEGPQSISRRSIATLEKGMIISNEPGCYREGEYGIRIENLVIVQSEETPANAMIPILGFETLTLCPIDRRLVDTDLLQPQERSWLNAYHARVQAELSPHLDASAKAWLIAATAPI